MAKKVTIVFSIQVVNFLDDLLFVLYQKNYFSYPSSAKDYVIKLYDYIEKHITTFPDKKTPEILKHLGSRYIFYNPNKQTTWFVFFEKQGEKYIITGILNNHCKEANYL